MQAGSSLAISLNNNNKKKTFLNQLLKNQLVGKKEHNRREKKWLEHFIRAIQWDRTTLRKVLPR